MQSAPVAGESSSDNIIAEINKLGEEKANEAPRRFPASRNFDPRSRAKSSISATRPRSSSRSGRKIPADPDWLCYYHYRFKKAVQLEGAVGKLAEVQSAMGACDPTVNYRLSVTDQRTRLRLLVDSGTNVSVLPRWAVKGDVKNVCEDYQ